MIRRFRDFAAAEDAVQEALLAAAVQWPREGIPDNPRAWLIQVASRRMTDHLRSEMARRRRETAAAMESEQVALPAAVASETEQDDTLILLFMCCHPALTPSSAIALTLRAVGGLTTAEIANAFLVPEATMAQRISRAKQSIKASGVPFRLPTEPGAGPTSPRRAARALPDLQRRLHQQRRPAAAAQRAIRRGDPADAGRSPAAAGRWRGRGIAGAHAVDRCAPRGTNRTRTAS